MKIRNRNFSRISPLFILTAILSFGCSGSNDNNQTGTGGFPPVSGSGGGGGLGGQDGSTPIVTGGTGGAAGTGGGSVTPPPVDSGAFDSAAGTSGSTGADTGTGDAGGTGGTGGAGGAEGGTSELGCEGNQVLPPVTDYNQDGPFPTTTERSTGPNGGCTIFRPDPLGTDGFLHPMITFGPGMATSGGTSYTALLTHLATLGYVVISVETLSGGPGAQANTDAMVNALNWLIAQNDAAGVYQGKLAVNCGVAMGYSLGASSSVFVAEQPAVVTTVAISGHIQMQTAKPHGPVLFFTGNGPAEVGDQVTQVVAGLTSAPGLMALRQGQGHLTVITDQLQPGKPEFIAMTAWLRYWVNGDENAKSYFWGPNCTMCSDPSWTLQGNALWDALKL